MLKILIENKELYIKMGTSIQMEMNNSIFNTEKIEGDVIFTFDVPAQKNDLVFSHARYIYVQRLKKYKAVVSVGGVEFANGDLYLQKSSKNSYSCGVVVNPYPEGFADRKLKENQYGEDLIISENLETHRESFLNFLLSTLNADSIIKFPLFYSKEFYGSSNSDWGFFNGEIASLKEGAAKSSQYYVNRLFINAYGSVIEKLSNTNRGIMIFNELNPYSVNSFSFAPAFSFLWLLGKVMENAGYKLTGDFINNESVKKIIFQSLRALDRMDEFYDDCIFYTHLTAIPENLSAMLALPFSKIAENDENNYGTFIPAEKQFHVMRGGEWNFNFDIKLYLNSESGNDEFFMFGMYDPAVGLPDSGYENGRWLDGTGNQITSFILEDIDFLSRFYKADSDSNYDFGYGVNTIHYTGAGEYTIPVSFRVKFTNSCVGKKYRFFVGKVKYSDSTVGGQTLHTFDSFTNMFSSVTGYWNLDINTAEDMFLYNTFSNKIKYADFVPDLTNAELLNTISNLFGLTYYIDSKKKQIELSFVKDTLLQEKTIELTKYVLNDETEINEYSPKKYKFSISPVISKEIDETKKLSDVTRYENLPEAKNNLGKVCFVISENQYYIAERIGDSVTNWSFVWNSYSGNDHVLEVGDEDSTEITTAAVIPSCIRSLEDDYANIIPNIPLECSSTLFDCSNGKFDLILLQYLGVRKFNHSDNIKFISALPICSDGERRSSGIDLTATGNYSLGEIYVKPWLNFLAKCEYVVYKFLVPLSVFLQIIALLKPQDSETKAQTRWALIDGVRLLPVTMTFEFTEGKENIKAEIKFAKEKITL